MRGEYGNLGGDPELRLELPPRARRILFEKQGQAGRLGTTSACAENTLAFLMVPASLRNYLRVRGEYRSKAFFTIFGMELPPRARRILGIPHRRVESSGTTSACAENTKCGGPRTRTAWNYLRVRGEYALCQVRRESA